jgi:hypothetical protein
MIALGLAFALGIIITLLATAEIRSAERARHLQEKDAYETQVRMLRESIRQQNAMIVDRQFNFNLNSRMRNHG